MPAKQGNSRNKINIGQITVYALLVALCLIIGYLENFLAISFIAIAPGVKLGLSNAVALILIVFDDKRGAWAVNITRICLSALLFGSLVSFLLSLAGGAASTLTACILIKNKSISPIGISIACGVVHNVFQLLAAALLTGTGVVYYIPVLIVCGAVCGAVCGVLVKLVSAKINVNKMFNFNIRKEKP